MHTSPCCGLHISLLVTIAYLNREDGQIRGMEVYWREFSRFDYKISSSIWFW